MTRPGGRLRSWASHVLDPSTMERLIDPAIADLQHEHEEAVRRGLNWRGRVICLIGYGTCWKVLTIATVRHAVFERSAEDDRAVGRAIVFSLVAVLALTAVLVLPVLQSTALRRSDAGTASRLLLYSVPSALVVAVPLGLVFGLLLGLRNRVSTPRVTWSVAALGILCSTAAFIVIGWLMPVTNQAFRELAAGRQLLRGFNELTLGELASGDAARLMRVMSGGVTVERLALEFHFRLALAFAPLALAMFSLGARAAQRRVHGLITTVVAAFVVCFGYYTLLNVARQAIYRDSLLSAAPAWMQWMPNLLVVVIAMLSFRRPLAAEPEESPQ
jgi:lipopolysaccharide export LptBFGC system permease protein LptF